MTATLTFADILNLTGGCIGTFDAACPECGPDCRAPSNRKRKVLRIWCPEPGFASFSCARCELHGYAREDGAKRLDPQRLARLKAEAAKHKAADDAERTERALALWQEAKHPRASPVELYLARRGLTLPDAAAGEAIRYHPACPFAGQRVPAMLALVRDITTDAAKAIHRTALSLDGRKVEVNGKDRLALGPIAGGAVKLTPDTNVTMAVGIGEGIETTLSLRLTPEFGPSPVWALLSAGGVENFPVLPGIESLWIAVDHDPAGIRAARTCARRWQTAGREVFLITPSAANADLNDIAGAA
jgi:hypothetical protein